MILQSVDLQSDKENDSYDAIKKRIFSFKNEGGVKRWFVSVMMMTPQKNRFRVIYFQEICNKLIASQQYYTTTCFINNPLEFTSHTEQKSEWIHFSDNHTKHTPRLSLKCLLYFFFMKNCWYVHISFKFNKKITSTPK